MNKYMILAQNYRSFLKDLKNKLASECRKVTMARSHPLLCARVSANACVAATDF